MEIACLSFEVPNHYTNILFFALAEDIVWSESLRHFYEFLSFPGFLMCRQLINFGVIFSC